MEKSRSKIPLLIIGVLVGVIVGFQIHKMIVNKQYGENYSKYLQVLQYVEDNYVDSVDTDKLIEGSIKGMFEELDPHTVYIPKQAQETIEEEFEGKFQGIGIEFQILQDTITVVSPITGGPSEELGIAAGDRIIKIEDENCVGFSNTEVMKRLRGEKGSVVNITIYRPSINEKMQFAIKRDDIPINSVDAAFMYNDSTAYVSISRFAETTYNELVDALQDLLNNGMKELILDLRNNPGGLLDQAYYISDLFIDDNKMIVYTRGREKEYDEDLHASLPSTYEKIPLVILVNRGSASASEIVSGAVQDWDRGLLVGETTYGKGLVQRPLQFSDGSAVRVTISRYYTPSGREIQRDYSDKVKYYNHLLEYYEQNSDNVMHKVESDSLRPVFKTNNGRTVYGGGGITPDYIVVNRNLTNFSIVLRRKNIYYEFVRSYMDQYGKDIKQRYGDDLMKFKYEYKIDSIAWNSFIDLMRKKNIEINYQELETDQGYIKARIKSYIARELWHNKGWYINILEQDEQFVKAVELINDGFNLDTVN